VLIERMADGPAAFEWRARLLHGRLAQQAALPDGFDDGSTGAADLHRR